MGTRPRLLIRCVAVGLILSACGASDAVDDSTIVSSASIAPQNAVASTVAAPASSGIGATVEHLDDVFATPNSQPVPETPVGWVIIEWDRLRFSVPPELSPFDESNECSLDGDERGGYRLTIRCSGATIEFADEQLHLIGIQAATRDAIVATVGVSSLYRLFNSAPEDTEVPDDWRWISRHGFTFAVPPDWPVEEQRADLPDAGGCPAARLAPGPRVLIGRGTFDEVDCDRPQLHQVRDGVRLFEYSDAERHELTNYYPGHQVFHHFLFDVDHVLRIGFGADSLTGLTIAASVRPTNEPANGSD